MVLVEIYVMYILILFDNILTHYQFFLLQKKKVFNPKLECNIVARFMMGGNPSPKSFIIMFFYQYVVIYLMLVIIRFDSNYVYAIIGAFVMVNYYHVNNLSTYKKNWNSQSPHPKR